MPKSQIPFRFRKNASIGVPQAEMDGKFLPACFVDNGSLSVALDQNDPRIFINGRTGSGKTALLLRIAELKPSQSIQIRPERLAFSYILNSDIIQFFENLNVRLDPFYKLLWRHVFVVELLKKHFDISSEKGKESFFQRCLSTFERDKKKQKAIKYLSDWENRFWEDTEHRIIETTKRIESELSGALEASLGPAFKTKLAATKTLSDEEKATVMKRGREVVNSLHLQVLDEVLRWLSEDCLTDEQHPYYILIDDLDQDWVEESLRYKLIIALLEAAKDFFPVRNAKVLVAIRRDLMERLFKLQRSSGYQEEKYQALTLDIKWSQTDLVTLLDLRVGQLVREQYTKTPVVAQRLFPTRVNREDPVRYLLERTFLRPRDVILFFNDCIRYCVDKPTLTQTQMLAAEKDYSKQRYRSIGDEWDKSYPGILDFGQLLYGRGQSFRFSDISDSQIDELCLRILTETNRPDSELWHQANLVFEDQLPHDLFRKYIIAVFYKVGLVGIRKSPGDNIQWSYTDDPYLTPSEIVNDSRLYIHKAFWQVLRVPPDRR